MTDKKNVTIILTNPSINNANKGCVALAYSAILLIDSICSELNIQCNLFLTGYSKDFSPKTIEINDITISYTPIVIPIYPSLKEKIARLIYLKRSKTSSSAFKSADLILDLGEGDSFSDIYGPNRFHLINRGYLGASKYNIPYCQLPQTIGPFKSQTIKSVATKTMLNAKAVMVRDNKSLEVVKYMSSEINTKEYIDLAFLLPYKSNKFDNNKIHVGLNVSALLWNGGYTSDNQFGLSVNYPKIIYKVIEELLSKNKDIQIHLISHVFSLNPNSVENDFKVNTDIYNKLNSERVTLAPLFFDPILAKNYIAGMNFFIGSRMHATIAAFSAGVPVVPLAYSRKFSGLFTDTLKYNHVTDLRDSSDESILSAINRAFDNRHLIENEIHHILDTTVSERLSKLKSDLKEIILDVLK